MINNILLFAEIFFIFSFVVIIDKLFKYAGLTAWCSVAAIIANIQVCKVVEVFGFESSMGNVLFASMFLATDIIAEKYCESKAKQAVAISVCSIAGYLISVQFLLHFTPSENDVIHRYMETIFSVTPRICAFSILFFALSNYADIKIFSALKNKSKGKKLWLRNNLSTIVCNCTENFLFMTFAFWGIYDLRTIISLGINSSILESLIAVCDTPFLYIATKKPKKPNNNIKKR